MVDLAFFLLAKRCNCRAFKDEHHHHGPPYRFRVLFRRRPGAHLENTAVPLAVLVELEVISRKLQSYPKLLGPSRYPPGQFSVGRRPSPSYAIVMQDLTTSSWIDLRNTASVEQRNPHLCCVSYGIPAPSLPDISRSLGVPGAVLLRLSPVDVVRTGQGLGATMISGPAKAFLLLIDGLDEFDDDCDELAEFLLEIISDPPNIKICLASRPWLE